MCSSQVMLLTLKDIKGVEQHWWCWAKTKSNWDYAEVSDEFSTNEEYAENLLMHPLAPPSDSSSKILLEAKVRTALH